MTPRKKPIIGIYPGTFDPITFGHADVVRRAAKITDKLIIAVSVSKPKGPLFPLEERCQMVQEFLANESVDGNIEVHFFDGLLVEFAKEVGANLIVRGLRAVSDFEYEFQMACMNSRLGKEVETIFLPASEQNQFISSKLVKEVASLKGDVSSFVIPAIAKRLYKHFNR